MCLIILALSQDKENYRVHPSTGKLKRVVGAGLRVQAAPCRLAGAQARDPVVEPFTPRWLGKAMWKDVAELGVNPLHAVMVERTVLPRGKW